MKHANIVSVATGLLSVLLVAAGCNQSAQKEKTPSPNVTEPKELPSERMTSTLGDAKSYAFGMIIYAHNHSEMFPTNLSQTLPYVRNAMPSGTNHFEILYHGTANLPGKMANGMEPYADGIILRSGSWQTTDGKWVRIYGFLDSSCKAHFEPDDNFTAWEKEHTLSY